MLFFRFRSQECHKYQYSVVFVYPDTIWGGWVFLEFQIHLCYFQRGWRLFFSVKSHQNSTVCPLKTFTEVSSGVDQGVQLYWSLSKVSPPSHLSCNVQCGPGREYTQGNGLGTTKEWRRRNWRDLQLCWESFSFFLSFFRQLKDSEQ